jgi:hypothetical protein
VRVTITRVLLKPRRGASQRSEAGDACWRPPLLVALIFEGDFDLGPVSLDLAVALFTFNAFVPDTYAELLRFADWIWQASLNALSGFGDAIPGARKLTRAFSDQKASYPAVAK